MNLDIYESWGRYPKYRPYAVKQLFWRNEIPDFSHFDRSVLPYAYGKSYGDSCLNKDGYLIDTKGLSKFIEFDKINGYFRCEAGVSLAAILDFIVPQGWFLAVTPGTKFISVGGAVANDVHGKNHHNSGTFGCQTTRFELVRSDGTKTICSPSQNQDLFSATIGGLGLTGLITWVEFKLKPCLSPFIIMESIKFDSIDEFFEINQESEKYSYTVSWVDCTASGGKLGRGIYNRGEHAHPNEIPSTITYKFKQKNFPFEAPFINSFTVNLFNILYFNKQISKKQKSIVHYDPFFYPLDAIQNWNRAYGKYGFLQYQFVIPLENSNQNILKILKFVADSGLSSFLTVLKTFGDIKSPGMLSFPRPGVTMAIDFRFDGNKTLKALNYIDNYVRDAGGVLYPAKDARMNANDFKRFYPNWSEFAKYIDPKFSSSFWRRVSC